MDEAAVQDGDIPLGVPSGPAPGGVDLGYWEGLCEGELRLPRCRGCKTWCWPAREICGHCLSFDVDWQSVRARGSVYSWIRTWHPYLEEMAGAAPYVTVLVELPHASGVRLLGLLTGDTVATGDTVVGTVERTPAAEWPLLRWTLSGGAR